VRIVGGAHKDRDEVGRNFGSRFTTDFAAAVPTPALDFEIKVLDSFGGTGSISFEFSSRGCREIDLVDSNSRSVMFISGIARQIGMPGIHTVRMDVFRFIPICKKQYDVVFADPPYDLKNLQVIPDLVLGHQLLLPGGWLVLEHGKAHNFKTHPQFFEERHYGSVHFTFFRLSLTIA
jgi:16S rRNA G966 N2-methylase RsmD